MEHPKIRLRVNAWFRDEEIDVEFPMGWEIVECRMAGHDMRPLSDEQMRDALLRPIGSPRLKELAAGQDQVVILFDDIPKPTPIHKIVPFVIEELHAGGISDDQIRFVCATGMHRGLTYQEFAAKLGVDIVARYPVYSHNPYENLVHVGTTSRGTPVHVNREYASCGLRIGIGSIVIHGSAGFGGGGKIVLPGISGVETIEYHHRMMKEVPGALNLKRGVIDDNRFRLDIDEAARLAALQFKVDAVLNNRREVVGLFAGDMIAEHRAGAAMAQQVYRTAPAKDADVVVMNLYPIETQFVKSTWCVPTSLKEGGDAVLFSQYPDAQNLHHLTGRFGTDFGGRHWKASGRAQQLAKAGRVIVCAPQLTMYDRLDLGGRERVVWCQTWDQVLVELTARNGHGTKVAVYPYAPIQLAAE